MERKRRDGLRAAGLWRLGGLAGAGLAVGMLVAGCNSGDPAVAEENGLLKAELEKVRTELVRAQAEAEIAREQLAKAGPAVAELPSESDVRRSLDRQQSEFRDFLKQLHPDHRIDRVWHEGLEMPDPEKPIRTHFVYFMTGPDGRQQSGQVPAFGDFAGRWSFGEFEQVSERTIIPPQLGEALSDPETIPEVQPEEVPKNETKTLVQIREEMEQLAKIKSKDGIPTHVILFDTPLKLSGAASGPIDSE